MQDNIILYNHEEDKISQLPDPILHKILSFLPTKDAAKTSVLSKTWNSVWNLSPVQDFDVQKYFFEEPARSKHPKSSFKKSVEEFCKHVDDSITRRRTEVSIQKFKLVVNFNNTGLKSRRENIKRWIDYSVSNNVKHLVLRYLNNTKSKKGWPYPLPMSSALFTAKSLKKLHLFGCKFVESGIQFQFSLKKLKLTHVHIDDRILQSLLSNCGSLEELTIDQCSGFQSVNLSSEKLQTIDLYLNRFQVQKVAIEAPNLRSLSYGGDCANVMRSLEVSNFNKNLTRLKFHSGITITDAIITRVTREYRFVEKIELNWCYLQGNIRLSDLGMGDRTIRLKNDELIADCLNCYYGKSPIDIPRGLYKLKV